MMDYNDFLLTKRKDKREPIGFKPLWLPDFLFPFQKKLTDWAIRLGRALLAEDCGLGKGPQLLVCMENVLRKENRPVLIAAPLAVAQQFVREANKFGMEVHLSRDGRIKKAINVTNYERLHYFNPKDFAGVGGDESSIAKNYDGKRRRQITAFFKEIKYRFSCTATPAPNDFMELGTQSELLGNMGRNQMLGMFFTNDGETTQQWRLKGHARKRFWEWVATWARAVRKPSDLGFDDTGFILPELRVHTHILPSKGQRGLFARLAKTMDEQRAENKSTIRERCEKVASLIPRNETALIWCHLNPEGDLLEKLIPGAVQVAGKDQDEIKEERLEAFSAGQIKVLITKPRIAGFGLNWQHCHNVFYFPTWSHEAYYQALRRCWRFGQLNLVDCHLVTTEAMGLVLSGMLRKERQSIEMYDGIIANVNQVLKSRESSNGKVEMEVPSWLK